MGEYSTAMRSDLGTVLGGVQEVADRAGCERKAVLKLLKAGKVSPICYVDFKPRAGGYYSGVPVFYVEEASRDVMAELWGEK